LSWNLLGNIAFYLATASSIIFALLYFLLAPWWKTLAGRNIMAVMGAMAVAFGYFSWAIAIGGAPPGFQPMRALIFLSIAASVTWRTVIFIKRHVADSLSERKKNELEDAR
jgi:hypothetical protein